MTQYLDRTDGDATRRIAYHVRGDGPLVVTVPGMGDVRSADDELATALIADGFRVAQLDLRGHGDSDLGFPDLGDTATASDMLALVRELGGPAILVGTSMSASSAIIAAAEAPELVSRLVLISPFVRNSAGDPRWMRAAFRVLFARPWGVAAWLAYYRSALNKGAVPADHAAHIAEIRAGMRRPGRLADFRRLAVTLDHQDAADRVGDVDVPVLAIIGAIDPDYRDPAAELDHVGSVLGAEMLLVENASHYPHRQRPDIVLPAIRAFAAQRSAPHA